MTTIRLTPAQLDAAFAVDRDQQAPRLARDYIERHVPIADTLAAAPPPLQLAGLAEVARLKGPTRVLERVATAQRAYFAAALGQTCRATHGDAMCLLEHGHRGRHVGRLSAAAVADWDDQYSRRETITAATPTAR